MSYRMTAPRNPVPSQDGFLLKDLKGAVETFSPEAVAHSSSKVQLSDVKPISSYSWIGAKTPTIAVPGYPRIWKKTTVTTVSPGSGVHYIDRNASATAAFLTTSPPTHFAEWGGAFTYFFLGAAGGFALLAVLSGFGLLVFLNAMGPEDLEVSTSFNPVIFSLILIAPATTNDHGGRRTTGSNLRS
ncbi:hypothetical protein EDC04DRAFT_2894046 [Pisolithus marmoratus]|nr:hypothetical protein EDC04DRAFT_2894046 [Pisolithus marmoratus]